VKRAVILLIPKILSREPESLSELPVTLTHDKKKISLADTLSVQEMLTDTREIDL